MRRCDRRPRVLLVAAMLVLAGCTRVVDDAQPQRQRSVGPIAAGQVEDLVSERARGGDAGNRLYARVRPDDCAGVAQEVHAPFVFDARPVAHTGGIFHEDRPRLPGNVVEIVGVYPSDFDPVAAVAHVERTIESCRDDTLTATTSGGGRSDFRVAPRSNSGSPQIVLWSLTDVDWACDNAYVSSHNAAVEITACQKKNGVDVLTLARHALTRIEALANATA